LLKAGDDIAPLIPAAAASSHRFADCCVIHLAPPFLKVNRWEGRIPGVSGERITA
jgi:hypothetical protein